MTKKLVVKAMDYLLLEDYKRIVSGKRLNILNRPYSIDFINKIIEHFESTEDYEKCKELILIKNNILNHDLNYGRQKTSTL